MIIIVFVWLGALLEFCYVGWLFFEAGRDKAKYEVLVQLAKLEGSELLEATEEILEKNGYRTKVARERYLNKNTARSELYSSEKLIEV